jgi:hypothetical protein
LNTAWGGSLALAKEDGHEAGYQYGLSEDGDNVHEYSLSVMDAVRETLLQMGG